MDPRLQRSLVLAQQGQVAAAEDLLLQLLAQQPQNADAWAMRGQFAAQQRNWQAAQQAFERSVQVRPAAPKVWLALAQVCEVQQRLPEALTGFEHAIRHDPHWGLAWRELARLRRSMGQMPAALTASQEATRCAPQDVDAWQMRAMLEQESGDRLSARASLTQALRLAPQRAALHHNLAVVLQQDGQLEAALEAHQRAQALGLDVADAHYNLAGCWQLLGQHEEALNAYRRALDREPAHPLALRDLSKLRWSLGHTDFDQELCALAAKQPKLALAPGLRGELLTLAEQPAAARDALRLACALAPDDARWPDAMARALLQLDQTEEAVTAHERAMLLAPSSQAVHVNAIPALLLAGNDHRAAEVLARARALAPLEQSALAWQGVMWRLQGDPRAHDWYGIESCTAMLPVPPPPGYDDMRDFNIALARRLTELHTHREAPLDQSLRHGTQTFGQLFAQPDPLIQELVAQLRSVIGAWLSRRPLDASHPFLARWNGRWRFSDSWSSRLRRSGFHVSHVHGHGWLSCCYYVSLPPSVTAGDTQAGWLQLGEPPLAAPLRDRLPPLQMLQPQAGYLALFPSYLWHGTRPFDDLESRLTVAFDVVPA